MVQVRQGRLFAVLALAGALHVPAAAGPGTDPPGPNQPPTQAVTKIIIEPERTTVPFAPAIDPEGLPLKLQVVAPPKRGTLTLLPDGRVTYAAWKTRGLDSFAITATDAAGASVFVTVSVTVPNVAPDPNVTRIKLRTGEWQGFPPALDRNGDKLVLTMLTPPKVGSVTIHPNGLVDYFSNKAHTTAVADRFVVRARDPMNASRDIEVNVDIGVTMKAWFTAPPLLAGGGGDDILTALGNMEVRGEGGDDILVGSPGQNVLLGGSGDDVLDGRGLPYDTDKTYWETKDYGIHDVLDGGAGVDTASYEHSPNSDWTDGGVEINLAAGIARGGHAHWDRLYRIENVRGSVHDDRLTGDGGPNRLDGGAGADQLSGGGGDDVLIGGEAVAPGPANVLNGRGDHLTGGAGADRYVYRKAADSPAMAPDRIAGFSAREGDLLDIYAVDGDPAKPELQQPALVAAFTGKPAEARIAPSGGSDYPYVFEIDMTGDKTADFRILFDQKPDRARIRGLASP